MKKDIHPNYFTEAKVSCVCGNTFITGSTEKTLKVELCSKCHPFYTGKQKLVDTARRVEKFTAKIEAKSDKETGKKIRRAKRAAEKKKKEVVVKTKDIKRIAQVTLDKK